MVTALSSKTPKLDTVLKYAGLFISLIALVFSTYQYNQGRKREDVANRPFLAIKNNAISWDSINGKIHLFTIFTIHNVGVNVAKNIHFAAITLDSVSNSIVQRVEAEMANPLPKDVTIEYTAAGPLKSDHKYLFRISLDYKDAVTMDKYRATFYYLWHSLTKKNKDFLPIMELDITEANMCDSIIKSKDLH